MDEQKIIKIFKIILDKVSFICYNIVRKQDTTTQHFERKQRIMKKYITVKELRELLEIMENEYKLGEAVVLFERSDCDTIRQMAIHDNYDNFIILV